MTLRSEKNDNYKKETKKGERGEIFNKDIIILFCVSELSERDSYYDHRSKRDI